MRNIITRIMFCVLVLCFVFRSTHLATSSVISLAHTSFFSIRNLSQAEYVCILLLLLLLCINDAFAVCVLKGEHIVGHLKKGDNGRFVCVCMCVYVCMYVRACLRAELVKKD